jgi:hypothetical protein
MEETMIISNRFLKVVCLFAAVSLTLIIPDTGLWAGTTGKIAGIVTDASTGEPLAGVNIQVEGTTLGAATDLEGLFYVINMPPAEYSVKASIIGYTSVLQQEVRVIVDRTTNLNFNLSSAILESEETVVVIAERPLVQPDVGSSQTITTPEEASALPVADIMRAVSLEPGVSVTESEFEVQIRGGGSAQVRFQVDGMERKDKLNDKVYTQTNSATVSEIQVLSGGFNAEYGNLRSGMFNIISKEGGQQITGSVDYRMAPGQYKHFGPDAYGQDQYIYKTYAGPNSFDAVKDVEGNTIFVGWNALAVQKNSGTGYLSKNDWTPQQLLDVWKYQTRGYKYADTPEHWVDAGLGGPIPGADQIGLQEAGFFAGVKYNRTAPIVPAVREFNDILSTEAKINFKISNNFKVVLSGLWGKTISTTNGTNWTNQAIMNYGYNAVQATLDQYKYYLAANDLLDAWTTQYGLKLTHSLSQSTFYELRYNYFSTETEAGHAADRNSATATTIAGVPLDEQPVGWVFVGNPVTDVTGRFSFYGEGAVTDNSYVKSHLFNIDFTSQVSNQHLLKAGIEYGTDHVVRHNKVIAGIIQNPEAGHFVDYDDSPFHIAGYVQDKIEYGGLIANVGLRVEHYDANGTIYDPNNIYSLYWARGGTAGLTSPDQLRQEQSQAYTYWAPRLSISHPVGELTKFFFNYGVYYNEPSAADRYGIFSESWKFGNPQGDIRRIGYANLEAPRTAAYEVGFEQSFADDWLVRAYFYSKDNSSQVGAIRVDGLDGSHAIGDFRNYLNVGAGAAGYDTQRNNNWEDIRGVEAKITRMRGRYFTGWVNMNYKISVSGDYGIQKYNQDPLVAYYAYSAVKLQPQTQPSFLGNFNFHTPNDFGMLWGDWRLSILQSWNKGVKVIYNPTGLPTREVRTIYFWENDYQTNLRLSKSLQVMDGLNLMLYMDVNNLFEFRALNLGNLTSDQQARYLTDVVDGTSGLGRKVGEYEDEQGNNVFTENWVDRSGKTRTPIAPERDFALWYYPRSFLFGVKVEF